MAEDVASAAFGPALEEMHENKKYKTVGRALSGGVLQPFETAIDEIEVFFVDFWQKFAVFVLVFSVFLVLSAIVPKIVAAIGRRAGCWPWTVTQTRYAVRVSIIAVGFAAAFGSVGVSYDVLFLGIVIAGATTSVGAVVSNALCGIVLQSNGTIQPGKLLIIRGERGIVVDTDLRHVRILILEGSEETGWRRTKRHMYVPNSMLCSEPYESNFYLQPPTKNAPKKEKKSAFHEQPFATAKAERGGSSSSSSEDSEYATFSTRRGRSKPVHLQNQFPAF